MSQSLQGIMTTNVVTASPQQSVTEVAQLMRKHNVGSVPIVENGQCIGIITDRDITLKITAKAQHPGSVTAEAIMSKNIVIGTPQMDVHEAADLMSQHQVRRLPVMENNRLTGIVALGDLAVKDIYQDEAGTALSDISEPASPAYLKNPHH